MKYYLIHQENELQVIPVTPEHEIDFLLQYSQQVLVSGETVREILQTFHECPLSSATVYNRCSFSRPVKPAPFGQSALRGACAEDLTQPVIF